MIKEIKAYTVICDNCGVDQAEGQDYSCWIDAGQAEDTAIDSEWERSEDEEKHYCTNCYKGVDEEDNIIIDKTRTKAE